VIDRPTALIGLDWGTSNCRAFRLSLDGAVLETRVAAQGILAVTNGDFAGAFSRLVGDWLDAHEMAPVLMSGMIGSRQGWVEAPYMRLPAGAAEIAASLVSIPLGGRAMRVAPGLVGPALSGGEDVMRGEETQILGAMDLVHMSDGVLCLPGTHSKWVELRNGRIVRFATFMTGEVYAVLRAHSILGRLMGEDAHDPDAFTAGLARATAAGGLLHQLFAVRTEGLFERIAPSGLAAFLSGLLVGHEIRAARAAMPGARIVLVGTAALTGRYAAALRADGVSAVEIAGEDAAARGLWRLADEARLGRV